MHMIQKLLSAGSLGVIVFCSSTVAQNDGSKILSVNGKRVETAVLNVEGRSYIDIEALAQAVGGSVLIAPEQITLTIPGIAATAEKAERMSKEFQQNAVFSLAEMREWRGAIGTIVSSGMPVVGTWPEDYRDRVGADLMQATLAASTEPDHQALQLLQREYALISRWADNVVTERKTLNAARTIDPNSLQNDESLRKISQCSQSLSRMIVSGTFYDDSSCH